MSPIQMLATFIANMHTEFRWVVSGLAILAVIYLAGKTIYDSQQQQAAGRVNIGGLIGGVIGIALLWFIAFNARDILCWVITKMGQSCPT
jgi:uncharacterized BrkB/YihY/UPF0761 family membrane protein